MGALARVALRPLAAAALVIFQVGCGTITLAPEPDGAVPDAGNVTSTSPPPPKPSPSDEPPPKPSSPNGGPAGAAGCKTDDDCHQDKMKRCDTATGACLACLTDGDCDGDRTCSAGKCAGADGKD